ncbi:hypothetical protein [Porphyromonas sp.]|uniref:hypothetical protein n=1 Tax=Porphyromonas sp. TaxID=1924944 RepID=UPI0026DC1D48|nr:hypothetical protein [Porphyromonas sp.]MDO4770597.1 hypothetical protein [Porphyromonas sp.]
MAKNDMTGLMVEGEVITDSKQKVIKVLETYITNPMMFLAMKNPELKIAFKNLNGSSISNAEFTREFEYIELEK